MILQQQKFVPSPSQRPHPVCFWGMKIAAGDKFEIIRDGAIVVESENIVAIGSSDSILKKNAKAERIDARGFIAIPGLINAHTHAPMGFFRGLGHGLDNMIETFLFPAERFLTPDLIEPLSYSYICSGLRSGVTCFADHYYFSRGVARALDRFGVRGVVGETVADLGGAFPSDGAWRNAQNLIEHWDFSSRIIPAIAPHAADTVSLGLLKEMAQYSKKHQIPLHMHLSQTHGERTRVMKREKISPVAFAKKAGALTPQSLLVHLVSADETDIKILRDSGGTAVICPTSQVIYEELAPIPFFFHYDVPIAIATDCAASNDSSDIFSELKVSAVLFRDRLHHIPGKGKKRSPEKVEQFISPEHLLKMTTLYPAKALGLRQRIGSLACGKAADIVFIKDDITLEPSERLLTNLVYSASSAHVQHVMVEGKWVLWNREPTFIDANEMTQGYENAVDEIKKRVRKRKR